MYKLLIIILSLATFSCSSTITKNNSETQPDVILARADNLSERPEWIKETEPFRIDNGQVISLGMTEIPADHNISAAYRISENNGKKNIADSIQQKLEFIFQNAEEGTQVDSSQVRYIGAEASKITTSSIRLGKRYWEKYATTSDSGERNTKIKVFTTVTMPEEDFKKAILDAIKKSESKKGISAAFAEKVDKHWEEFTKETSVKENSVIK